MESSSPPKAPNRGGDDEDFMLSFGSRGSGKDTGHLRSQETKVDVAPFVAGITSEYRENIWAYQDSSHGGGAQAAIRKPCPGTYMGSESYENYCLDNAPRAISRVPIGRNMSADSPNGYPSAGNSGNGFLGGMRNSNNDLVRCNITQNMYARHGFSAATSGNNGSYSGTGYYLSNKVERPSSYGDQRSTRNLLDKLDIDMLATDQYASQNLQILCSGRMRKEILERVHDFRQLMEDQYGHHLFQKLLDGSAENELELIVNQIASLNGENLLSLATNAHGSNSFQRLIKHLKRSPRVASVLTSSLATRFSELMVDRTGRHVIKQCLNFLGDQPNEVLYDLAISKCCQLATDKIGCLSLNDCIDCISTSQRKELLNRIAGNADFLSKDPCGNYVVQHVLNLQNQELTEKICDKLRGHYRELSSKKGGSHVLEKCISSKRGMVLVVEEFLDNEKTLGQIARDQYGNYVIQRALKATKVKDRERYGRLVSALLQNRGLEYHKYGKKNEKFNAIAVNYYDTDLISSRFAMLMEPVNLSRTLTVAHSHNQHEVGSLTNIITTEKEARGRPAALLAEALLEPGHHRHRGLGVMFTNPVPPVVHLDVGQINTALLHLTARRLHPTTKTDAHRRLLLLVTTFLKPRPRPGPSTQFFLFLFLLRLHVIIFIVSHLVSGGLVLQDW
ncbi:hypothetical protein RJ640_004434 [Escallonia rubra]|uniref:PUM-HD domain-containing protein n=1 Tax=Escallonia rubra TaxID=112253 RepID=A0AA88U1F4_9ASTE|nr:hypothetical protein RJ640_004434 [Escallonia rubra]